MTVRVLSAGSAPDEIDYFAVIGYGAADPTNPGGGLRCSDLYYDSPEPGAHDNDGFSGVGLCGGPGDGICKKDDLVVTQLQNLQNTSDTNHCIRPAIQPGFEYQLTDKCVFQ